MKKNFIGNTIKNLRTYFSSRWAILTDKNIDGERRIFAGMELFCFPASFLTLLCLLAHIVIIRCGVSLPDWTSPLLNVLLSAAIGYITNYIAIEMLFKPYEPDGWHPLSIVTLGYWKQGLIPKNKNRIGSEMGQQIETKLLNPEQLADELCAMVMAFVQSESVLTNLRNTIQGLLHTHEKSIIDMYSRSDAVRAIAGPILENKVIDYLLGKLKTKEEKCSVEELVAIDEEPFDFFKDDGKKAETKKKAAPKKKEEKAEKEEVAPKKRSCRTKKSAE